VERAPRQYSWTGYRQLFEMVRGAGLKLQVVLSFHACGGNVGDLAQVPLPSWVLQVRAPAADTCRTADRRSRSSPTCCLLACF
jgi:beta-amylase